MSPSGDPSPDDRVLRTAVEKGLISKEMADSAQRDALLTQTRATEVLIRKGVLTKHIVDNLVATPAGAPLDPQAVAGFKIIGQLGKGGMGTVYRALQVSMNREVALKVIARQFAQDPGFCERFLREARAAGAVNHPNVITCYDVGQDQEWLYMALELMTGGDAAGLAREGGGQISEVRALRVIADCARGLGALKRAGLIHRDIKPANIFISQDGIAKLGDLGLARSTSGDDRMTMTGAAMGTPAFMSPEQASGESDLDIRTDLYALGATLFSMLTGDIPFHGASAFAVVAKVINDPTPDPRLVNPAISDATAAIVMTAMAKSRDARYATPDQLIEDVERVLTDRPPLTAVGVPRPAGAQLAAPRPGTAKLSPPGQGQSTVATVPVRSGASADAKTIISPAPTSAFTPGGMGPSTTHLADQVGAASAQRRARSRLPVIVLGIAIVMLGAGVAYAVTGKHPSAAAAPAALAQPAPATPVVATPAPAPAPTAAPVAVAVPQPPHVASGQTEEPLSLDDPHPAPSKAPGEQLQPVPDVPAYQPAPPKPLTPQPVASAPAPTPPSPAVTAPADEVVATEPVPVPAPVAAAPVVAPPPARPHPAEAVAPPPVPMPRQQLDNYRRTLSERHLDALVNDSGNNTLAVTIDPEMRDISALDGLPVAHLECQGCSRLTDLRVIRDLPLVSLSLNGCSAVSNLAPLQGKPLVALDLSGCENLSSDLGALSGMHLKELHIAGCRRLTSLDGIEASSLTTLDATDCRRLSSISALAGMPLTQLELVHCPHLTDLEALRGSPLEILDVSGCDGLATLQPLAGTRLRILTLDDCRKLTDLQGLENIPLEQLAINRCPQLVNLLGLHTTTLTALVIVRCPALIALNGLQGNRLKTLELTSCPALGGELRVLHGMPLEEITLRDCGSLLGLNGLEHAPLRKAVVVACRRLTDLSPVQRPGVELITGN